MMRGDPPAAVRAAIVQEAKRAVVPVGNVGGNAGTGAQGGEGSVVGRGGASSVGGRGGMGAGGAMGGAGGPAVSTGMTIKSGDSVFCCVVGRATFETVATVSIRPTPRNNVDEDLIAHSKSNFLIDETLGRVTTIQKRLKRRYGSSLVCSFSKHRDDTRFGRNTTPICSHFSPLAIPDRRVSPTDSVGEPNFNERHVNKTLVCRLDASPFSFAGKRPSLWNSVGK